MPTISATPDPDRAYVLVRTDWAGTLLRDMYTRVSGSGWGNPDVGPAWTVVSGAAGDFTVDGTSGLITHAAVNTSRVAVSPFSAANVDMVAQFTNIAAPVGGNYEFRLILRYIDGSNFVDGRVFLTAAGTTSVNIRQIQGGVETLLGGFPVVPGLPVVGSFGIRVQAQGSTVRMRVWLWGTPEPATWNLSSNAATLLAPGGGGVATFVDNTVTTPTPITFAWDNVVAVDLDSPYTDCAIVTRRNTVTGEVVQLRPYVAFNPDGSMLLECGQGLWWDTEPPLNVPLEYCTFACDQMVDQTANAGFETGTAPWTATGGVLTQSCSVSKVDTCSGLLTPTGGGVADPRIRQTIPPLAATTPISASAWVMSPQGWNSVLLRVTVTYIDGSTQEIESSIEILDDNEWRFLQLSFTPRTSIASGFINVYALGVPPNTTLFYFDEVRLAQLVEVTASDCVTVTVDSDSAWLKSPLHPCLDIEVGMCDPEFDDCADEDRISYVGHGGPGYGANTVLLDPANRRRPIPQNRIRNDAADTVRYVAHSCEARVRVLAINEPGDELLIQLPAEYCIPDRYISVGEVTETYLSIDQREEFRLMALPYVTVDRPPGPADGICGSRVEDLCDIYSSWAAMAAAGLTWTDLLLGEASDPQPPAGGRNWGEVEAEFADFAAVEAGGTRDWAELRDGL